MLKWSKVFIACLLQPLTKTWQVLQQFYMLLVTCSGWKDKHTHCSLKLATHSNIYYQPTKANFKLVVWGCHRVWSRLDWVGRCGDWIKDLQIIPPLNCSGGQGSEGEEKGLQIQKLTVKIGSWLSVVYPFVLDPTRSLSFPLTRWLSKGPSPTLLLGVSQNDVLPKVTETADSNCKPNGYGGSAVSRDTHL